MYSWVFMITAIITEVLGLLAMKHGAETAPILGLGVMYLMLIISYGSLAIAIKRIPMAVAYGAWESLGLILISLSSALLFAEPINSLKIMGIISIIVGMLLLEHGSYKSKTKKIKLG